MLSFVIPAFNEAANIERCVTSVVRYTPKGAGHEIIVVDNGSKDETVLLAGRAGARVVASDALTIGAVRNEGVRASRGDVLVFLDADCELTAEWGRSIDQVLAEMRSIALCCAGAQVFPPASEAVFLWKYWFLPFVTQDTASHIGSANMVCLRDGFMSVGGFDEELETGEDYEFCMRLKKAGGVVLNVPALRVEHHGFPRTWAHFLRRERWHGRGDVMSLQAFKASKVAVVSVLFVALTIGGLLSVLAGFSTGLIALAGAGVLLAGTSAVKFRHAGPIVQAISLIILPVYFLARTLSAVDALSRRARRA